MIGQSQVTEPLMTALRTGRIGHAYLFSGPRGCGKTTSARILARCLNCAEGPTDQPCGVCPSCVELSRDGGGSLDVVEIDAASHGGVDDARDLRERAAFAPARDRFKIFIIDEAHMVTAAGFNALLKIVEEPPPHVKFVFATTEPDKVIGTIRSRTHHYPFRLIAPGTLIDYVQSLCDSEGVRVEPGVLPLVVRAGGGSVRDTLSILDQLIAGSEGDTVTADRAAGLLGFTHTELIDDVVTALGAHDAAAAFRSTDRVVQTGQDPRRFVEDLLERLRDLIVVSATTVEGAAAVFRGVPQDQLTRMYEQAQAFARGELSAIADTVSGALDKMAGATAPRLQLELMIARALLQGAAVGAGAPAGQPPHAAAGSVQAAAAPRGAGAVASGAQAPQGRQPAPAAAAPAAAPAAPKADPLAALAAARGAVFDGPPAAAAPATAAAPAAAAAVPAPTAAAVPEAPAAPAPPNAAETAASVRDFLREDTAGTPADEAPASSAAPQQAENEGAAEPERAAEPEQPGERVAPAAAATPQASSAGTPHPNSGAASFGRPISDVLSGAQLSSMGSDAAFRAPAEDAPAPSAPASDIPEQPQTAAQPAAPGDSQDSDGGAASATGIPTAPAEAAGPAAQAESEQHDDGQPAGFDDLLELWPELLEELQHSDRDAWNAVRVVQPLALDGDVLAVGLASSSDLAVFKSSGAGPLREAINEATGLSVKYVPKRIEPGAAAQREPGMPQRPQPGEPDSEEPHRGGPRASAPASPGGAAVSAAAPAAGSAVDPDDPNDPVARAAARLSVLGPALAAPAWADPVPQAPTEPAPPAEPAAPAEPADTAETGNTAEPEHTAEPGHTADLEHTVGPAAFGAPVVAEVAPAVVSPGVVEPAAVEPAAVAPAAAAEPAPAAEAETDADAGAGDYDAGDYGDGPSDDSEYGAYAEGQGDPYAGSGERAAIPGEGAPASPAPPAPARPQSATAAARPEPKPEQAPEPEQGRRSAPSFNRYGEAIVREVLGARFIEERPLPSRPEV